MKNIGKPCTGKPFARFDEGGQGNLLSTLPRIPIRRFTILIDKHGEQPYEQGDEYIYWPN